MWLVSHLPITFPIVQLSLTACPIHSAASKSKLSFVAPWLHDRGVWLLLSLSVGLMPCLLRRLLFSLSIHCAVPLSGCSSVSLCRLLLSVCLVLCLPITLSISLSVPVSVSLSLSIHCYCRFLGSFLYFSLYNYCSGSFTACFCFCFSLCLNKQSRTASSQVQ